MPDSPTVRGPLPETAPALGAGEGASAPFIDGASLLDVLDRVLERGIVVEASATGALPSLDLTRGEASLTIASSERAPAAGTGWDALAVAVAAASADRGAAAPPVAESDELWRSGEHAALRRQFERLNA